VLAEKWQELNKPDEAAASGSARDEIVVLFGVEVCGQSYLAEIAAADDVVGFFLAPWRAGMIIARSRAIIAMTTSNSINVKPLFLVTSESPAKIS